MTQPRNTKTHWTPERLQLLRDLYPDQPTVSVATQMGLTSAAVYNKAHALGLKKSPAYLASEACGRVQRGQQHPHMVATQFRPGHKAWNKGISHKPGGRCAETQFKPGNRPHTWVPVGSYRVVKTKGSSYLEQKVNDLPGNTSVRWKGVHRLVWEAHHGPVPTGHIVIFKDPDQRTTVLEEITIDKLTVISRHEHAMRNHPRSKHPELGRLVQLKGAITRQVNRLAKEQKEQRV